MAETSGLSQARDETAAQSALVSLYMAKRPELVRFFTARSASANEAEDIVQEMFLKLAKLKVGSVDNPGAFLYRLGYNLMIDRMRSRRRSVLREDAFYQTARTGLPGGEDEADVAAPEAALYARQRLKRLVRAIDGLPPQCRRVFIMHKLEDYSYAEIADALNISRSAVEKHMISALRRLSDEKS